MTAFIGASLKLAVLAGLVHTVAMIAAGGCLAFLAYKCLGAKSVARRWFNLDTVWAASLVEAGLLSLVLAVAG